MVKEEEKEALRVILFTPPKCIHKEPGEIAGVIFLKDGITRSRDSRLNDWLDSTLLDYPTLNPDRMGTHRSPRLI